MRGDLRDDLKAALKARDRTAISALRSALAAIDNAEAVPAKERPAGVSGNEHVVGAAIGVGAAEARRRELTDADVRGIVENERQERLTAATEYEQLGRTDLADNLRAEADVLARHV